MQVLIDITRVFEKHKTGIHNYQLNLFSELITLNSKLAVTPFYYSDSYFKETSFMGKKMFKAYNRFISSKLLIKNFYDRIFVVPLLNRGKFDIVHATAYRTVYGMELNTVMTIHDLIFMRDPAHYNSYFSQMVSCVTSKVRKIIAVSETTKNEILEEFPNLPEKRIKVIYEGVDTNLQRITEQSKLFDFKQKVLNSTADYILYLGSFTKRKNIPNLIRAYNLLKERHTVTHKLVLVGKPLDAYKEVVEIVKALTLKDHVIIIDYLDDKYITLLLSAADVFIFPSLYEGFGLPVLEAMRCGCPCIVSNTSSLKELFWDSAFMIDPLSITEMADAMNKLLTDRALRDSLINSGFKKAEAFTWKKTAESTMQVYEEMAAEN